MIELDESQERAAELMMTAPFCVVSGGPGVGKTATLQVVLDRMDERRMTYSLCAPTGKAGVRMSEATGRPAQTIHRLLEWRPGGFQRNEFNPLDADVVIVDEASMIDVELAGALFSAIDPDRTRVVCIGDRNQLPPVGPGRVFGDLVESGLCPVAMLTKLHRSSLDSWIHVSAQKILAGEMPDLARREDFEFVEVDDAAGVLPAVCRCAADVERAAQVIIPMHPGAAGITAANVRLQTAINPRRPGMPFLPRDKYEIRIRDRVIQTRNDYTLSVFNGEVGEVLDISKSGVVVEYAGRAAVTYSLDQASALQLAYALTVHKSQGSEFPWVIVVCHSTHSFILRRELIYTAITRAKKGVVLIGDRKGLARALSDREPERRNTALIERIKGELPA